MNSEKTLNTSFSKKDGRDKAGKEWDGITA
jgi:hypothetical protein